MKTLQDLREQLYDEAQDLKSRVVDDLDELTQFKLGEYRGKIRALEWVCDEIRVILKHHECEFNDKVCLVCGEAT